MDTQHNLLPVINRREFMPIMRYGRFAGPGYSGGLGSESYFTKPDGTTILIKDLVKTPEGLGQVMQELASVEPVDFIDAVTKQHDIAYTVVEMRFMTRVSETFQGRYEYQLTAEEKNSAEFRTLVEAKNREYWEADKPMLESLARYQATNPLTQQYRDSALVAFGAKGHHVYGFKEETEAFFAHLKTIDSSIESPSIGGSLGLFLTASRDAKTDFEAFATLPFSEQEKGFFIQHLENFDYLDTATYGPDGNLIPSDQMDYRYRIPVPVKGEDDIWNANVRLGDTNVQMVLDRRDPNNVIFTRTTIINGEVVKSQVAMADPDTPVDTYGQRKWFVLEFEGEGDLVSSYTITKPELYETSESPYAAEDAAAVLSNDYESVLKRPFPAVGEPKPAPVLREGDAAYYLDEETSRYMINTSWGGVTGWESVLEHMFGRPDITISFSPEGVGVLLNENNEPIGFVYRLPGRENPVLENMDGEIISVSQDGKLVRLDPSTYEETPIDIPGYLQSGKTDGLSNLIRYQDQHVTAVLGDINSLVSAIQSGKPLPKLSSGLNLLNDFVNPLADNGVDLRNVTSHELNATTTVVGGLNSLYSLQNAFKNGDTLDKITATASTVNFFNGTLYKSLNNVPAGAFNGALDTFLNGTRGASGLGLVNGGTPGVLPVLGLINSIRSGDPVGITQSVIGIINPQLLTGLVGWALMAVQILQVLFADEPPEAWGTGKVVFDDAYGTQLDIIGEAFGKDRVRNIQQNSLDYFRDLIAESQRINPSDPLGLIPQRMPTITWRERRQGDPGYAILDIDPLTGAQRYPYLRFDDNGVPFSADPSKFQVDPTDPEQRIPFMQAMVYSALRRQALAPMWEVKTAKMQQDAGDPNAGLSEEERFGKAGLSAPVDAATNKRDPGAFRPIVMDMNGNGQLDTVSKDASGVTFDWDASGFQKKVAWAGSDEGFLFLDRNPNGAVDSGKELFSNSMLADAVKGMRSMAWVDGNADGKISALDPVFNELRVWQDNGDGVMQEGEGKKLAELGITEIDYQMGRFMRNGQYYAMGSPELEADDDGTRINVTEAGIRVENTGGDIKLYITRVSSFTAGNDGVAIPEDGDVYPRTTPVPTVIAVNLLLSNDEVNGINTGLEITSVGNATHGTVWLGEDPVVGKAVYFTPDANYNGPASFDYTVVAYNGMTRMATVSIDIAPVNDLPEVSYQKDQLQIYGYGVLASIEMTQSGSDFPQFSTVVHRDKGLPFYAPYQTVGGRKTEIVYNNDLIPVPVPIGPVIDTNIPVAYFQKELEKRGQALSEWGGVAALTHIDIVLDGESYRIPVNPSLFSHSTPIETVEANSGRVTATDPDGASFRYTMVSNAVYGSVTLDEQTGQFSYTGRRYVLEDVDGTTVNQNVDTNDASRYEERFTDVFTVRVIDLSDPSGNTFRDVDVPVTHYGPRPKPEVEGGGKKPIAIDLNGDGFHFVAVDDSNVFYDVNGDGWRRKIAWNNPDDGFIAFDRNGDGKIDRFDEISFVPYKPDGQTDLEGLRAFDTNNDGVFSAADADWAKFGVWQDANSNGITDAGEFRSLDDMGIQSIALTSDGQFQVINGQTVHGTATAAREDGTTLAIADVTLEYRNVTRITKPDGTIVDVPVPRNSAGEVFDGTVEDDLVFGTVGSDRFLMGEGDDTVMDDGGNDVVEAGAGNDLIYTGNDNDVVDAGTGDDIVFAGNGNDLLFGGDGHDLLMAENGNDVVFGGAGNDFISGGAGNDVLSGNEGDDKLAGEDGYDVLFGQEGNDELYGHAGNDLLYGGDGNDILDGGEGDDQMEGDAGDDTYVVDSSGDQVIELANGGRDTVLASVSYALHTNLENLTLTGEADLNGTGNEQANILAGNSGTNVLSAGAGNDILDGGRGADTLIGGHGDDTYVVDHTGDLVMENAGEGIDVVRSRISYTLGDHVENLKLIGIDSIQGAGNAMANIIEGNAASNRIDGGAGADEMRGGRGNDTYVVDDIGDQVIESSMEGVDSVEASIDYTLTDNVENLRLTGNAAVGVGNSLDNVLIGNAHDNVLEGGIGADLMAGGEGNDTYFVDNAGDVVIENVDGGIDTVTASVSYSLAENVENLSLVGSAVTATGNALANAIAGNSYDNLIDGGANADQMAGGAGNDTYIVDHIDDTITEHASEGTDHVLASASHTLSANVENLALTGEDVLTGSGNELGNELVANDAGSTLYGMAGDDQLVGGAGNDYLDGGSGADGMQGGLGDDTYVVDDAGDAVAEFLGAGDERVYSGINYVLPDHVEHLILTGGAHIGIGNELDNTLTGNALDNQLDGGHGADRMSGGAGNDTYIVDNAGDAVIEQVGEGNDTVMTSVSYSLADNVENLTLTGVANLTATGNELANVLTANAGDSTLLGLAGSDLLIGAGGNDLLDGGSGADVMQGGAGDDTYIVDDEADAIGELAGNGMDTVLSSATYSLSAHVENLLLTGIANISATGNELDNVLIGNDGDNVLSGLAGHDSLMGGAGDDVLVGGRGDDLLEGGAGNDDYWYFEGDDLDRITEIGGFDTVRFGPGLTLDNLALRVVELNGRNVAQIRVLDENGDEQHDQGIDFIVTIGVNGQFVGPIERFVLDNGDALVLDDLLIKKTTIHGTNKQDSLAGDRNDNTIFGNNNDDVIHAGTGHDHLYGENGADILFAGGGNDQLYGGNQDDSLYGEGGDDLLDGGNGDDLLIDMLGNNAFYGGNGSDYVRAGAGNDLINEDVGKDNGKDVLQAGGGNDFVYSGNGNDLIDAGSGNDAIYAGNGDDWIAGGAGDDIIDAGQGRNLIAFGRGDGNDTISNSWSGEDTISLGGIRYADLTLSKSGNDLTLNMGEGDSITIADWYADPKNRGIGRLQVITVGADYDPSSSDKTKNSKVEIFDFSRIVQRFDAARAADPAQGKGWGVMNDLLDAHLQGTQTQALGGDLSFQYATTGSLAGIGLGAAQSNLNNVSGLQTLKSRQQLEQGEVRLV